MRGIATFSGLDLGSLGEYLFPVDLSFAVYRTGMTMDLGNLSALWRNSWLQFLQAFRSLYLDLGLQFGRAMRPSRRSMPGLFHDSRNFLHRGKQISVEVLADRKRPSSIHRDGQQRARLPREHGKHWATQRGSLRLTIAIARIPIVLLSMARQAASICRGVADQPALLESSNLEIANFLRVGDMQVALTLSVLVELGWINEESGGQRWLLDSSQLLRLADKLDGAADFQSSTQPRRHLKSYSLNRPSRPCWYVLFPR